jgi:hypothetical protein
MRWTSLCAAASLIGCGSARSGFFSSSPGSDAGTVVGEDGGASPSPAEGDAGSFGTGTGNGGTDTSGCSDDATNFVYVLTKSGSLYKFAPDKKVFTKIGDVHCGSTQSMYNSMAVDRKATAWVNVIDPMAVLQGALGFIYRVNTKDASCEPAPALKLVNDWTQVGMGFSVDAPGGTAESLFVMNFKGPTLGKVDTNSMTIQTLGSGSSPAELTGTAKAQLFGFFTDTQPSPTVGLIDKQTAKVSAPASMNGLSKPTDWAFSYWGGHFYLYTQSQADPSSNVTDYDPVSGSINSSCMRNTGLTIVGAGVSTCAPTVQPPPK